jgi:hypothetical protein
MASNNRTERTLVFLVAAARAELASQPSASARAALKRARESLALYQREPELWNLSQWPPPRGRYAAIIEALKREHKRHHKAVATQRNRKRTTSREKKRSTSK